MNEFVRFTSLYALSGRIWPKFLHLYDSRIFGSYVNFIAHPWKIITLIEEVYACRDEKLVAP